MSVSSKDGAVTGAPSPVDFYRGDDWHFEESIGYLLRQAVAAVARGAETEMRTCGLTAVQWAPLMIISRGGAATAANLARELNTDTGAMTRMLDRLEAKGLLCRTRSSSDRRVVELTLTDSGRAATERIPFNLSRAYNAQLAGFTLEEFTLLKGLLRRLILNAPPPPPPGEPDPGESPPAL
jgi:DNA-binding MarR family transcriptional regulator